MKVGKKNLVWWVYDRFGRILLSNCQKMVVHHARYVRVVHIRSSLSLFIQTLNFSTYRRNRLDPH